MQRTKNLVFTALCIALGLVLPMAFHSVQNAGTIFLPMHIPVLLCGLITSWPYALACGVLTPLLSSILTGMPPLAYLPSMLFELATYGLVASLLFRFVHTKRLTADLYISLVGAMLAGRVVAGILKALIFNVGNYSLAMWVTGSFITALPGIIIQIVAIPVIVGALRMAKVVDRPGPIKKAA